MENISKFPNRRIIKQEAVDWLIRLDGDEPLSKHELEALREWLSRSPAHREELNSLNDFWSNNILTELVVPLGRHEPRTGFFEAIGKRFWSVGAVAATAVAGALIVAINLWLSPDPIKDTNGVYLTAVGRQKSVTLADGSVVQLNTNSQIAVEYNDRYRNINLLQGEAHFEVAKDSELPFRVYAGAGRIQAVGTAFTVLLMKNGVNVLVTEGRVALAALGIARPEAPPRALPKADKGVEFDPYANGQSKDLGILKAGESITLDIADGVEEGMEELRDAIEVVNHDELSRRQSWRDGLLVFSGEPLEQVILEISRYTTVSIEISDPELRQIQIGGRFKVGDIDNMFNALEANFGLQVNRLNYNYVQLTAAE